MGCLDGKKVKNIGFHLHPFHLLSLILVKKGQLRCMDLTKTDQRRNRGRRNLQNGTTREVFSGWYIDYDTFFRFLGVRRKFLELDYRWIFYLLIHHNEVLSLYPLLNILKYINLTPKYDMFPRYKLHFL